MLPYFDRFYGEKFERGMSQRIGRSKIAKKILEEKLVEFNSKIQSLEARLDILMREEHTAARHARICQLSEQSTMYQIQDWVKKLTPET